MPKYYSIIIAILSIAVTALFIGWKNNLDYWRRIHTINCELTRPANEDRPADPSTSTSGKETIAPAEVNTDKPTDQESVDGWMAWARAARSRDPNWLPQLDTRLSEIKGVRGCAVEFTVLQIDDSSARIVLHNGERIWLTGFIPGLVVNKSYACKALFSPAGSYQYKTAEGVRTLPAYRYLGELPEVYVTKR